MRSRGYTMIEVLATCAIMVVIAGMGLGIVPAMKAAGIQGRAVSKIKQIGAYEESYHGIGDLGINPDGSYGTFEELQNAGYIADDLAPDDTIDHAAAAYIPYYRVTISRTIADTATQPDQLNYAVTAIPIGVPTSPKLPILFMEEDGEVFTIGPNNVRRIVR